MPSDDAALCAEAITAWHRLVHEGILTDDDHGLRELRTFVYGERRLFTVARPNFLTPGRYESEALACALVAKALAKVCAAVREHDDLLAELDLSPEERDLVLIDPGFQNPDVHDRFDAFVSKRLRLVEFQGSVPGGVGFNDVAARAFRHTAPFERLAEDYELEPLLVLEPLRESMISAWHDFGGSGEPAIAIVDWSDAALMMEFEIVRDHFRDAGLWVTICDPRELSFDGRRLRAPEGEVDLVYRRLTIMDILARPDETRTLVDAARAGAVCLVDPFASDVAGHKSIFDVLTDERLDFGLTPSERNAVGNHVPWTRALTADAKPGDRATVGPEYAIEHRESLVLKPVHEFGGHGVTLGWQTEPHEWEQLVVRASAGDHLVQRRIVAHRERFPVDEPGYPLREFYVDNDPYMFRGRVGGILTRLSPDPVTNVSSGGSVLPTFLIRPG